MSLGEAKVVRVLLGEEVPVTPLSEQERIAARKALYARASDVFDKFLEFSDGKVSEDTDTDPAVAHRSGDARKDTVKSSTPSYTVPIMRDGQPTGRCVSATRRVTLSPPAENWQAEKIWGTRIEFDILPLDTAWHEELSIEFHEASDQTPAGVDCNVPGVDPEDPNEEIKQLDEFLTALELDLAQLSQPQS